MSQGEGEGQGCGQGWVRVRARIRVRVRLRARRSVSAIGLVQFGATADAARMCSAAASAVEAAAGATWKSAKKIAKNQKKIAKIRRCVSGVERARAQQVLAFGARIAPASASNARASRERAAPWPMAMAQRGHGTERESIARNQRVSLRGRARAQHCRALLARLSPCTVHLHTRHSNAPANRIGDDMAR